jgi:hypothetical protein
MTNKAHEAPCSDLSSFKKLTIGILTLQGVFVIASLSLCLNAMNRVSGIAEQQIQIMERQRAIESKTDEGIEKSAEAIAKAGEALAMSSRAEANIQWIREGLTEIKVAVRQNNLLPQPKGNP